MLQRSISLFIAFLTELRTVSPQGTDMAVVNRKLEDISLAVGELLMFADDFKGVHDCCMILCLTCIYSHHL